MPADAEAGANWLQAAADQGHARAQFNLGVLYARGHGRPQDPAQATAWYRKSADQGYDAAQLALGIAHATGEGAPRDFIEAYRWFAIAARTGNPQAVRNRDRAGKALSPDELLQGQELVRDWLTTHGVSE